MLPFIENQRSIKLKERQRGWCDSDSSPHHQDNDGPIQTRGGLQSVPNPEAMVRKLQQPPKKSVKTAKRTHSAVRNQRLNRKNEPKTNPNEATKSFVLRVPPENEPKRSH